MNFEKLKEIAGALVAVIVFVLGVGGAYMEWRIDRAVQGKFDEAGLVSVDKIEAIEDDIAELRNDRDETRSNHNRDSERMDSKIERIVDILLEE